VKAFVDGVKIRDFGEWGVGGWGIVVTLRIAMGLKPIAMVS